MHKKDDLLIGAHTSTSGGLENALFEGKSVGANCIQLFTSNQRQWRGRKITETIQEAFEKAKQETSIDLVISHASYLMNLASPNEEIRIKSKMSFTEEIERCLSLGISFLNFHPGATLQDPKELGLQRIIDAILEIAPLFPDDSCRLLLEATAGQGSCLGAKFEELAYLLQATGNHVPIGICVDTCHIFSAGYDIRDLPTFEHTWKEFDRIIGLHHLYALHLNDSVFELGARKDRHAPLGEGKIGMDAFRMLVQAKQTKHLPMILETPGGVNSWDKEIWKLKELAKAGK